MRQVPRYLLIGNGRVARHFRRYFTLLNLPFLSWNRNQPIQDLQVKLSNSTHILLLISDQAINPFITQYINQAVMCVHFSGSLVTKLAHGAHPLMTFNEDTYTFEQYHEIPFIIDHDAPDFQELLPGVPNTHARLSKALKAKYHALCVLSGNFSCMLWQKLLDSLENEFKLSKEVAYPYLIQQTKNLLKNNKHALTGPLVRKDIKTIESNIDALHQDPFQQVYKSFVDCYTKITNEEIA